MTGLDDLVARLGRHPPQPTAECGRVECEPDWSWQPTLRDHDAWLVVRGRGHAVLPDGEAELRTGSLVLLRPGDTGRFRQDPLSRLTVLYCHFTLDEPAGLARHRQLLHVAPVADLMTRLVRLNRDPHPLRRLDAVAVLLMLLAEIHRQDSQAGGEDTEMIDPRLQEVLDFVHANPGRRPSLDEAASIAGLAPPTLSRLFTRQLGLSFRQYVLQARLERARQLLSETTMTIGQIARALGYPDVFLFSRQFSRQFGAPPSSLRQPSDGCNR
ncbi:MAG: AraC family transcriptional regulator [Actinoplanes sp.]